MTTPTIKPALPAGTILSQHAEADFQDFVRGRPVTQRVLLCVVQAGGTASENNERGRNNKVKYETLHAVEVVDTHKANDIRHLLTELRADRGYDEPKQAVLFASDDVDEQREEVLGQLREWAGEQDPALDDDALAEKWVSWHGGNYEHRLDQAPPAYLREFAISVGAVADAEADGTPVVSGSDEGDDDGDDPDADDYATPDDEPVVPAPAFSGAP